MTVEQATKAQELLRSINDYKKTRGDIIMFEELTKGQDIRFDLTATDEKGCKTGIGFWLWPEQAKQVFDFLTEAMAIWKTEAELGLERL